MEVYIIICPENGWDCIIGVYLSLDSLRTAVESLLHLPEHDCSELSFNELGSKLDYDYVLLQYFAQ